MTARSMLAQAATKLAKTSDETLSKAADKWLRKEDLTGVTFKSLISAMENEFQIDLSEKRALFKRVLEEFTLENMKKEETDEEDAMDKGDCEGAEDTDSDEEETGMFANSSSKRKNSASSQSHTKSGSDGHGGGGFQKEVQLSNELSDMLGTSHMPRTQVTKKIWEYIKENNLQNPNDKREIMCDSTLEKILKTKKINMFKMTKALAGHMKGVDDLQDGDSKSKKAKAQAKAKAKIKKEKDKAAKSSSKSASKKDKKGKKKREISEGKMREMREKQTAEGKGFNKLMELSPALATLLGEKQCSRPQVVKLLWARIKENNLQNPANKSEIFLDSEMKGVFGCDSFTMFSMNKYLKDHLMMIQPTKISSEAEAKESRDN